MQPEVTVSKKKNIRNQFIQRDTHPLSPPAAAGVWAQAVNWGTIGDRNLNAAEDAGNEKAEPV